MGDRIVDEHFFQPGALLPIITQVGFYIIISIITAVFEQKKKNHRKIKNSYNNRPT